eukprot:1184089-Amphidinium_carterae.1
MFEEGRQEFEALDKAARSAGADLRQEHYYQAATNEWDVAGMQQDRAIYEERARRSEGAWRTSQ